MNVAKDNEVSAHNTGSGIAQSFNFGDIAAKQIQTATLLSALAVVVAVILFTVVLHYSERCSDALASANQATKTAQSAIGEAQVATYNFALLQSCMESSKCDPHKLEFRKGKP